MVQRRRHPSGPDMNSSIIMRDLTRGRTVHWVFEGFLETYSPRDPSKPKSVGHGITVSLSGFEESWENGTSVVNV